MLIDDIRSQMAAPPLLSSGTQSWSAVASGNISPATVTAGTRNSPLAASGHTCTIGIQATVSASTLSWPPISPGTTSQAASVVANSAACASIIHQSDTPQSVAKPNKRSHKKKVPESGKASESGNDKIGNVNQITDVEPGASACSANTLLMVDNNHVTETDGFVVMENKSKVTKPCSNSSMVKPLPKTKARATSSKLKSVISLPLSGYTYHIMCRECYKDGVTVLMKQPSHSCNEDTLVVQHNKSEDCFRIRERKNHTEFFGKYKLCNRSPNHQTGMRCPRGNACTFPHSDPESLLWNLEKSGKFDIREFVSKATGKPLVAETHTLGSVLMRHPGQLAFLCRTCFTTRSCVAMQSTSNPNVCGRQEHTWSNAAILAHRSPACNITLIGLCPCAASLKQIGLCRLGKCCDKRWTSECLNAHSVLERELWHIQLDCHLDQMELVVQASNYDDW